MPHWSRKHHQPRNPNTRSLPAAPSLVGSILMKTFVLYTVQKPSRTQILGSSAIRPLIDASGT
jgi:hypothetical protein